MGLKTCTKSQEEKPYLPPPPSSLPSQVSLSFTHHTPNPKCLTLFKHISLSLSHIICRLFSVSFRSSVFSASSVFSLFFFSHQWRRHCRWWNRPSLLPRLCSSATTIDAPHDLYLPRYTKLPSLFAVLSLPRSLHNAPEPALFTPLWLSLGMNLKTTAKGSFFWWN